MKLKGEWSAATAYDIGDVVRYTNGGFYQMVRKGKAGSPCPDALYWNILPSPLQETAKMIMDIAASLKTEIEGDVEKEFGMVAPEYSKKSYTKGDICKHNGKLYKAKQNISSENWTASHWDEITVGGQIAALNTAAATIPTNISDEGIVLKAGDDDYLVSVDASGDDPEVIATLIEEGE